MILHGAQNLHSGVSQEEEMSGLNFLLNLYVAPMVHNGKLLMHQNYACRQ